MRATHFVRYAGAQPAEFGLDAPAVALTIQSGGEAPVTLSVSASGPDDGGRYASALSVSASGPDDGGRYASVSTASDRVFVIKSEDVDKIAKQVTDFRRAG